jgi:signal transduction histidine kinase
MKDKGKTKEHLIKELEGLRLRVAELGVSEVKHERAEEAFYESERELTIRNRVAQTFITSPDEQIYGEVLQIILEAMESRYGVFGYINQDGALVCPSLTREIWDECQMPEKDILFPRKSWRGLWSKVLIEQKTHYSSGPFHVPSGHIPVQRALAVPIIHQGEVIGLLHVADKATDYGEKDCGLLETIAGHIAPILQARLQKNREEGERRLAEEALQKSTYELDERVKELNCLYGISKLRENPSIPFSDLLQGIVDLIPPAWQYPEITCARIILNGQIVKTKNFNETIWKQASDITVHEERIGNVEVYYMEEKKEIDEGPFVKEERSLINAISERLERIIERNRADEALWKARGELERRVEERTSELVIANDNLNQEIQDRTRAEEALKKSSEKIKLFAYSVSHDLKNPAIGIYGLTKLLHKNYSDILDNKGKNYCDQILRAAEQIAALVEMINVYISTKEAQLNFERVKLKELLQMTREEFSTQLNIRQIKWLEPENPPEIKIDRLSIVRVLRNLVDNALKYGGDDLSEIKIGYKETDEFHILSVKDDGVGIKDEDAKKIFGLFQRQETSIGIEGAGLGLAIVKDIVEQHRGKVWVEPGPEKGITIYISISRYL